MNHSVILLILLSCFEQIHSSSHVGRDESESTYRNLTQTLNEVEQSGTPAGTGEKILELLNKIGGKDFDFLTSECDICREEMKNCILGCGHGICETCVTELFARGMTCHQCREDIAKVVKIGKSDDGVKVSVARQRDGADDEENFPQQQQQQPVEVAPNVWTVNAHVSPAQLYYAGAEKASLRMGEYEFEYPLEARSEIFTLMTAKLLTYPSGNPRQHAVSEENLRRMYDGLTEEQKQNFIDEMMSRLSRFMVGIHHMDERNPVPDTSCTQRFLRGASYCLKQGLLVAPIWLYLHAAPWSFASYILPHTTNSSLAM